jgi:hypothetical protein
MKLIIAGDDFIEQLVLEGPRVPANDLLEIVELRRRDQGSRPSDALELQGRADDVGLLDLPVESPGFRRPVTIAPRMM